MQDPFFIFYDARSGSTYLAKILVENAKVCIPPETNFVSSIIREYGTKNINNINDLKVLCNILSRDHKFSDWNIDIEDIAIEIKCQLRVKKTVTIREFIICVCELFSQRQGSNIRFGFKKGSYISYFKQLKIIFPKAQFIHLIRDGRAVFNSKKHSIYSGTGKPFETDASKAARRWKQTVELSRHIDNLYPESSTIVHYEDLVENSDLVITRLMKFLDLDLIIPSLDSSYNVPKRYGKLHENIGKKALKNRIDAWKETLKPTEIEEYELVAGKVLESEGYFFGL